MSQTVFDFFISLVKLDSYLYDLSQKYIKTQENLICLDQQICTLNSQLKQAEAKLQEFKRNIDFKELELKTLDVSAQGLQAKLNRISGPQQFLSLQTELDKLFLERSKQEDVLIWLWNELEQNELNYKVFVLEIQESLKKLEFDYKKLQMALIELAQEKQQYELQRPELLDKVPQDWLSDYLSMKEKVVNPVVAVKNQSCGACFCVISVQDLASLNKRKLLHCKECYRLLYIDSPSN
ncbi:MAG: zinc ribbon domain-containing protein, partial [Candidatus Amoebophilus sp.]